MMKKPYIVTSSANRFKEGFPHLCWMDIGVAKLQSAAAEGKDYQFICHIGEDTFDYSYPASTLLRAFEQKKVRIKGKRYTFFIDYAAGVLYRCLTDGDDRDEVICTLNSQPSYIAHEKLDAAVQALSENPFPLLVARTALWATDEEYKECLAKGHTAKYPRIRRKPAGEKRGKHDDLYWDDNNYPNAQMKASLKKRGIIPIGYETCHIWEGTCYDPRYHTCYANLVLLPRAIASLSDHDDTVKAILKWQAYERFNGFIPEDCVLPEQPTIYERIKHLFND